MYGVPESGVDYLVAFVAIFVGESNIENIESSVRTKGEFAETGVGRRKQCARCERNAMLAVRQLQSTRRNHDATYGEAVSVLRNTSRIWRVLP